MSGDFARFNAGARNLLEADVGTVEDPNASCAVGPCEDSAAYRVPWPQFGGDVAYCPYHLARYRSTYPKEFQRVQEHVDDDLSAYATRGDRFLALADVPTKIRSGRNRRVGLTELGGVCREGLSYRVQQHGFRNSIERVFRGVERRTSSFSNCFSHVDPTTAETWLQAHAVWWNHV